MSELGKYGREHLKSLRQNRPKELRELQEAGELSQHLRALDQEAREMFDRVVSQLLERGWTQDQAERSAREIVNHDLVLVPDEETEKAMRDGYVD